MKHKNKIENSKRGVFGEKIACMFLMKRGFRIIDRNFKRKCGELDIIAKKKGIIHFVEVKSKVLGVSRETKTYSPEENIHSKKVRKLLRVIQLYLSENNVPHETPFQVDGVSVLLDDQTQRAYVKMIEHINIM